MTKGKVIKIVLIGISFIVCGILYSCSREKSVSITSIEESRIEGEESSTESLDTIEHKGIKEQPIDKKITVYVCGEVMTPGVYELVAEARVYQAIEAAGGMTEQAVKNRINLAEQISDGQMITVLSEEEAAKNPIPAEPSAFDGSKETSGKVNINSANQEELMTLPGVGSSKASDIIAYREQNGNFKSIEQLMEIKGIKEGMFNKIKDLITVN